MFGDKKELGIIEDTSLGFEDHGIFSFMISFDFGGSGQGFGNYGLSEYDKEKDRQVGTARGLDLIIRILEAVGARYWEDLKGKTCWVERENGMIVAIEAPAFIAHKKKFDIREWQKEWYTDDATTK